MSKWMNEQMNGYSIPICIFETHGHMDDIRHLQQIEKSTWKHVEKGGGSWSDDPWCEMMHISMAPVDPVRCWQKPVIKIHWNGAMLALPLKLCWELTSVRVPAAIPEWSDLCLAKRGYFSFSHVETWHWWRCRCMSTKIELTSDLVSPPLFNQKNFGTFSASKRAVMSQ